MCGILFCQNSRILSSFLESLDRLSPRGPDAKEYKVVDNVFLGFTRLSIMDTSNKGMQPFSHKGYYVICNGEIYNHRELRDRYNIVTESASDCEVILPLLLQLNEVQNNLVTSVQNLLTLLDGEFAFVVYSSVTGEIIAARDRYGVRPLFYSEDGGISFSSEAKGLSTSYNSSCSPCNPRLIYHYYREKLVTYVSPSHNTPVSHSLKDLLINAVEKRLHSDRPIGFLLSGGLDSSIIVSIAAKILGPEKIVCFSVGLEGSVDIEAAKKVVEYLGIPKENHHIVTFTVEEGFEQIEEVIRIIESYDVTTVRASTPQLILAKEIKKTGVKVILSGEGSDELHGSYRYFRDAPNEEEFQKETERLLDELYMYDNLRTDRTLASQGIEARVPFLDIAYVNHVLSLPAKEKMHNQNVIEKKVIRDAFVGFLPNEILYRRKEAFSDAVSSKDISWYKSIERLINKKGGYPEDEDCLPTIEARYCKHLYNKYYPGQKLIKGYWLPRFQKTEIFDPSATVLESY